MEALEMIQTRRSVRSYQQKDVPDKALRQIIECAMCAPSAGNAQPWHFIIIRDKDILNKIPALNSHAAMAPKAPVAICICADTSLERYPGFWPQDCSAATQNLLLSAHALGYGGVWTAIYPFDERIKAFRELLHLPETILPLNLVPLGVPTEKAGKQDRFHEDRLHENVW